MAYFSNGTEGMVLDNQCSECIYGEEPCPIALMQLEFNYEQIGNTLARRIMDTLIDEKGICQMKKLIDAMPNQTQENKNQLDIWNEEVKAFNKTRGG
jgi:hypothetical protein